MCGKKTGAMICPDCGFDPSRDYEQYPTLTSVKKAPAVSALRKNWQKGERAEEPKKKRPWLSLIASILILALGIGIGAGIGRGKPEPTEPQETVQMQEPPETTILLENTVPPETTTPPETTEPLEPWEANILCSDACPEDDSYLSKVLAHFPENEPVFGSEYQRKQIASVTFLDALTNMPSDAWDVSEAGNGKVMAWVKPEGELYDLYIGADGGVWGGISCKELFSGYVNVSEIIFGDVFHTENVQNMSGMFNECESLKRLDLSNFNTSNLQDMSGMFSLCYELTSLDLSGFDTFKVDDMSHTFSSCMNLTNLDLSNFNTSNVQNMEYMYSYCTQLTDPDTGGFDTSKVQNMDGMFVACSSLTALDLRNFSTSEVQRMEAMFWGCSSLTKLNVSSFDTSNVLDMSNMFEYCESLKYLELGDRFLTANADTTDMFTNCPAGDDWQHLLK